MVSKLSSSLAIQYIAWHVIMPSFVALNLNRKSHESTVQHEGGNHTLLQVNRMSGPALLGSFPGPQEHHSKPDLEAFLKQYPFFPAVKNNKYARARPILAVRPGMQIAKFATGALSLVFRFVAGLLYIVSTLSTIALQAIAQNMIDNGDNMQKGFGLIINEVIANLPRFIVASPRISQDLNAYLNSAEYKDYQLERLDPYLSEVGMAHAILNGNPVAQEIWSVGRKAMFPHFRAIAIIGNLVLLALACAVTSLKVKARMTQTLESKGSSDRSGLMEKAMRRDVSTAELKSHAVPGDVWMAISGMVCDISDFVNVHPGGADLMLRYAGTDATEHFLDVGHSEYAKDLIRARLIGVLEEGGVESGKMGESDNIESAFMQIKNSVKTRLPTPVVALFTKEDPFQFHKICGALVIAHFIARFTWCLSFKWVDTFTDPFGFDGGWFSLASAWFCIVLQLSSFQFILPRNRVLGKPMLWQEWRAHNLIFVLRSLGSFTVMWAETRYRFAFTGRIISLCVLYGLLLFQLRAADMTSDMLRDSKHESLTATWPLWEGCPVAVERFLKFYYSVAINQLSLLTFNATGVPPSIGCAMFLQFTLVLVLQTDSFAMTLVRKNIISTASFHFYYWWNMLFVEFIPLMTLGYMAWTVGRKDLFWWDYAGFLYIVPVGVYIMRFYGLSKYGCWLGVFVNCMCRIVVPHWGNWNLLAIPIVWIAWAVMQFAMTGFVLEFRVRRFLEGGRMKPLRLASREHVGGSFHLLSFELPAGYSCGLMPGQHAKLLVPNISKGSSTWNGKDNLEVDAQDIGRSYTPVSPPDSKHVTILVKHYPKDVDKRFPQGGRASTYLVEQAKVGDDILVSGPHGHKIYFGNGQFEVQVGQPKVQPRIIEVVAAGSGITPAVSMIREIQAEARRKANKFEAWRMLDFSNAVNVDSVNIMHLNRTVADALPLTFYEDSSQKDQLVPIYVRNIITGMDTEDGQPNTALSVIPQDKWSVQHGKFTKEAIAASFHPPNDDVVVFACGPHDFVANVCQPLLKELGYKHVIGMW